MIYSKEMITNSLKEICAKHEMTKDLVIKDVKYVEPKDYYLITLGDSSEHTVPRETINLYIESLGDKEDLTIAGLLLHDIEAEESVPEPERNKSAEGDYWDGNMNDVIDYMRKKKPDSNA